MSEMEQDNIVELLDEEGNSVQFEHMATIEHEGEYYICLVPADESEAEEVDVVIMKIITDAEGNEAYETVDDEEISEIIFEKMLELLDEEDDAEEDSEA